MISIFFFGQIKGLSGTRVSLPTCSKVKVVCCCSNSKSVEINPDWLIYWKTELSSRPTLHSDWLLEYACSNLCELSHKILVSCLSFWDCFSSLHKITFDVLCLMFLWCLILRFIGIFSFRPVLFFGWFWFYHGRFRDFLLLPYLID